MFNLGILGGSFDPIHLGHVNMLKATTNCLNLHHSLVLPNKIPYYKKASSISDKNRLELCHITLNDFLNYKDNISNTHNSTSPYFTISNFELTQENYTSTFELLGIIRKNPQLFINGFDNKINDNELSLNFIMGMDSFLKFNTWKNYTEILNLCNIAVLIRPNYDFNIKNLPKELEQIYQEHFSEQNIISQSNGQLFFIPNSPIDISSSELRFELNKGNFKANIIKQYLSSNAIQYIKQNKLYQM